MRLLAFLPRSCWLAVLRRCSWDVGLVVLESISVAAWSQYRQYKFTAFASVPYLLLGDGLAWYVGRRIRHARTAGTQPDREAAPAGECDAHEQETLYSLKWAVGGYCGLLPFVLVAWCGWTTPWSSG